MVQEQKKVPDQQEYGRAGNLAWRQAQQSQGDSSQRSGHTTLKWAELELSVFLPRPLPSRESSSPNNQFCAFVSRFSFKAHWEKATS